MQVNKIAVIGSGVMGSGIAAQAANGGFDVTLLDIVPEGAEDRNGLAKKAIEKQIKNGGFAHPSCAARVTPANMEDDLASLSEADWIVEVVVEKLSIKQKVYGQIESVRKKGSIVSSNTSTIPLAELISGMPDSFKQDFMISHFFNPPRHMRLIEMVPSPSMDKQRYAHICDIADKRLGKYVVHCKDTPGFIANRIGVYWLTLAMNVALMQHMRVELADTLLGRPIGVPKTAIFGLYDLIGIDLMPLIAEAMVGYTDDADPFTGLNAKPELLKRMIKDGYTGRKGKGGFYKMEKMPDGSKVKQALDLSTGEYHPATDPILASANAKNISELLSASDMGGEYAREVMVKSLHYAASLLGEIADDIASIDAAMRYGYSWKYGPFELIDIIGTNQFATYCHAMQLDIPGIIRLAGSDKLYKNNQQLMLSGDYKKLPAAPDMLRLSDLDGPLKTYEGAALWDMGDGIYNLQITTKMHVMDESVLSALEDAIGYAEAHAKALVIGSDEQLFSAGANLHSFLDNARSGKLDVVDRFISHGQSVMQRIKYASVPIVPALSGIALGGGCELLYHAHFVQPHLECRTGLVEVNVGVVPAWGGCKESLVKRVMSQSSDGGKLMALTQLFADIVHAKTAMSAYEAKDLAIVPPDAQITMNSERLLADAKQVALRLAQAFVPMQKPSISLPEGCREALSKWLAEHEEKLGAHTAHIASRLMDVLCLAENADVTEQEQLDKEREIFMELLAHEKSQKRIEYMLDTGKPLVN